MHGDRHGDVWINGECVGDMIRGVCIALLYLFLAVSGGGHGEFSKEAVEREIVKFQSYINRGGDELSLGRAWGRLGLLYQVKAVYGLV